MRVWSENRRRAARAGTMCAALALAPLIVAACGRAAEESDRGAAGDQPTTTDAAGGLARSGEGAGSGGSSGMTTSTVAPLVGASGQSGPSVSTTEATGEEADPPHQGAPNDEELGMTEIPGASHDSPEADEGSEASPGVAVEGSPGSDAEGSGSANPEPDLPLPGDVPGSVTPPPVRQTPPEADPAQLQGRTWYVYAATGPDGERVAPPWPVWMVFAQGQALQIHLGCNSGSGRWVIDGPSIRVEQMMSTLMACFEVGDFQPFRASEDANYRVHSDGSFTVLVADDGVSSVELTADSD